MVSTFGSSKNKVSKPRCDLACPMFSLIVSRMPSGLFEGLSMCWSGIGLKGVLGIPDVFPQVSGQPRKWIDRWIDGETIQEQPSSPQPSASSQQPIASGQQPAASNPQPTANSKTLEAVPAAFVLRQRRNSPEYPHESPSALSLAQQAADASQPWPAGLVAHPDQAWPTVG